MRQGLNYSPESYISSGSDGLNFKRMSVYSVVLNLGCTSEVPGELLKMLIPGPNLD